MLRCVVCEANCAPVMVLNPDNLALPGYIMEKVRTAAKTPF